MYSSPKKLECFYRDQLNKTKQEPNAQHHRQLVQVDNDDDEVEKIDDEPSDNEDDDYLFESAGSLKTFIDNVTFLLFPLSIF
jgi:hypothetical protein